MTSALGVTVKSGWASVVIVGGPLAFPVVMESSRIDLSDPAVPDSRQPYHDGFGTARAPGRELDRLIGSVRRFGVPSVTDLIRRARAKRLTLRGAGIVVGSLVDPATLGNSHVRIHALEGLLFRGVVLDAAQKCRLPATVWRERDLLVVAAQTLGLTERKIRDATVSLGRTTAGPWRAEHKQAALAGWLVLAGARATT